eukprot:COSAG06_NODE_17011_length_967_cov_0.888249_2_plen_111_part_00
MALAVTKHQSTWFDAQGFYCGGYHTCQLVKLVVGLAVARTARRRVVCKDVLLYQVLIILHLFCISIHRPIVLLDHLDALGQVGGGTNHTILDGLKVHALRELWRVGYVPL